jgi:hypothetical protein
MKKSAILASVVALGVIAGPAITQAHHAVQAQFDVNTIFKFKGEFISVDWQNPHAWFHFALLDDVTSQPVLGADGKPIIWSTETVGPNGLRRLGLSDRRLFVAGDIYTVEVNPDRSGATKGFTLSMTFPDGRYVRVGFTDDKGNGL